MKLALHELKSIAACSVDRNVAKQIDDWIERNIEESGMQILIYHPENPDMQKFRIEEARHKLGKVIAEKSCMYPSFSKTERGFECRMTALYFKDRGE